MSKRVDVTTRELLAFDPPSWATYCRLRVGGPIRVIDSNVATTVAEADQVYRVANPRPHRIHIEMEARWDKTLPRRLWRYNASSTSSTTSGSEASWSCSGRRPTRSD